MRTTLDIDDEILAAAKEIGRQTGTSAGKTVSELARLGLAARHSEKRKLKLRNGVPIFQSRGEIVTSEHVRKLLDSEGA